MAYHAVPSPPTGTVTLLFTDIEGSTKRWEHLPQAMATALARHDDLLRDAIEAHRGYVFKTVGDAFCAAFADPAAAARSALAAQHALATEEWGETGAIRVRMALHTGTPEQRADDYFGPPVNRVARLLSTGYGEQVLLSAATADLVRPTLADGIDLIDLGAHRLKDLLQPEHIYQLAVPWLPTAFPPIKSLDRQPHNLPAQPTPLVGREDAVVRVRALLEAETRLLTLTGPGGTGKTRLALQAAAELLDAFPDGAWFVGLAPLTDPALVVAAIAQPLGVRESGYEPLEQSLLEYLRDKHLLLVIDNFEHVLPAAPAVGRILAACLGVTILATSRAALRVYGERELTVPPLALPDLNRLPPADELATVAAVELFVERAQAVKPGFAMTAANARAVAEICVRLEGLPLAIELAATRVRILPPDKLLARLTSRLDLLTGGASDRDARQQTLRGTIAWSYDLLLAEEQTLFRRLAPFAGSTFEATEAVAAGDGAGDVLDGLESLVAKSLLRQEEIRDEPRFFMLESIREFAAERLEESGEGAVIRGAHAAFFLTLAEAAEPELIGPNQIDVLNRLDTEYDNIRGALTHYLDIEPGQALRLAASLWRFWWTRGYLSEGRRWLDRALHQATGDVSREKARALDGAGVLVETQGDLDHAKAMHEAALAIWQELDDSQGIAHSLANLGYLARDRGDFDEATRLYDEVLGRHRAAGDLQGVSVALYSLGTIASLQADHDRARGMFEESLALDHKRGDQRGEADGLSALGVLAFHAGDYAEAETKLAASVEIYRAVGDRSGLATVLANLGHAVHQQGDSDRAIQLYEEALTHYQDIGDKAGSGFTLAHLGRALHAKGDVERARVMLVDGLVLSNGAADQVAVAEGFEGLAVVAATSGDAEDAARLLGAAGALRERISAPLPPVQETDIAHVVATSTAAIGVDAFLAAKSAGVTLSVADAIALTGLVPSAE